MANTGYFKQLKELINCYVDKDGRVLTEPTGRIKEKGLDSSILSTLRRFVILLLDNKMVCEETRIYITDLYITYKGVADKMEKLYGTKPNINTIQTKLWNDKGKIVRYFGESMLVDLIEYQDIDKVEMYEDKLNIAYAKFGNDKILKNIALDIPESSGEIVDDIEQERFEQLISVMAPYSKQHMKFISDNLDTEAIKYCRYILTSGGLSSKDKFNREKLMSLLVD